jgi:IS605 OrfB family transposase
MRLEPDRRHITISVIGTLRSKENTRALQRHVAKGNAHILSMTLSERWGRLFVSIHYAVRIEVAFPSRTKPSKPDAKAGVDLGLRSLATIANSEDEMVAIVNPAPLPATQDERRRVSQQLSRRIPGSRGHRRAKAKLARLDRRAVCVRRETIHQLTHNLVDTYGEVHIEDLNLAGMKKSMGRRAFRRSVSDAALGMFRPMLSYKAEVVGTKVVVVDRFYFSSQIHHGCGGLLQGDTKLAKVLTCYTCYVEVDRDENAAKNIRNWPEHANPGSVGASALSVPGPPKGGTDGRSDGRVIDHRARLRKTNLAAVSEARTEAQRDRGTPQGVHLMMLTKALLDATVRATLSRPLPMNPFKKPKDLVKRHFVSRKPNGLWCADITNLCQDKGRMGLRSLYQRCFLEDDRRLEGFSLSKE